MRIGVFTVLFQNLPFEEALDRVVAAGLSAVEIGTGGYPGSHHCPVEELLESETRRQEYMEAVTSRGLIISGFSCHYEPLSPDQELARESDEIFRKTVRLASLLEVPVVNAFAGLPAGAPGDTCPNWVTCPWPPYFLEMLDYQWEEVAIPYWKEAGKFAEDHGVKVAIEMHPGQLVYNVDTLLRLRDAVGPVIGCNFDPSHLFWNGVDPVAAIRKLGDAIFHVHGKDVYVDPLNVSVNGCNDNKPYDRIPERSWTFRTIGYGHGVKVWKDIMSAFRLVGYDYVISIEHEDALMSFDEGLAKAVATLKEAGIFEPPGEIFWA
ncbi:MAG TPA: sugar phosphate isomerase/epimerase [Anaerolineae bacterium]|nr:sugar phosphate isomerase/epimerase [Anaerolineae bacterium]